jgi:hypothetical protein
VLALFAGIGGIVFVDFSSIGGGVSFGDGGIIDFDGFNLEIDFVGGTRIWGLPPQTPQY